MLTQVEAALVWFTTECTSPENTTAKVKTSVLAVNVCSASPPCRSQPKSSFLQPINCFQQCTL